MLKIQPLNFVRRMTANSFVQNIAVLSLGSVVAKAVGILATPILSRMFSPAEFGLLATYVAVGAISATILTLRYETRVLIPKSEEEAKSIVTLVVFLALSMGVGLLALSIITPSYIFQLLGLAELGSWLTVAIAAGIATAIISAITAWFSRCSKYVTMARLQIVTVLAANVCSLTSGFLSIKNGLLYSQAVSLLLGLIAFIFFGYRSLNLSVSPQDLLRVASTYRRAPCFLFPTALIDVFTMQLPCILISAWFSNRAAGQYQMAIMLLGLPLNLVGNAISIVFFQRFSAIWPDAKAAKSQLLMTWKTLALFGAPLVLVLFLGEYLFTIALGQSWSEAGRMAAVLAPMFFASLIHLPTSSTLAVMGLENRAFYFGLSMLIYRPLTLFLGFYFDNLYLGLVLFVVLEISQILVFQFFAITRLRDKSYC